MVNGTDSGPLLEAHGLNAGYGAINVLWDVDLTVGRGEIVALVGSNGAGKTTLLRVLSGLIRATSGSIVFWRRSSQKSAHRDELVHRGLVHVPEGRRLFPDLNVEQNLLLGAVTSTRSAIAAGRSASRLRPVPAPVRAKTAGSRQHERR